MALPSTTEALVPVPSEPAPPCPSHTEQPCTNSCPRCAQPRCARCGGYCARCADRDALAPVVRRRARRAIRFLIACGVLALGFAALSGVKAVAPKAVGLESAFAVFGYGAFYMAVGAGSIVAFLRWLHGAMRLAPLLGAPESEGGYSPRAAVVWWFVPLAHYVMPYRIVRELHARLGAQEPEAQQRWTQTQFQLWWGFWLTSKWVDTIAWRTALRGQPGADWFSVGAELLCTAAAWLAVGIVRSIQARTEARLADLGGPQ